jgi:hypothetical protein
VFNERNEWIFLPLWQEFTLMSFSIEFLINTDYNLSPSYSGGRDQEDCGSKPAQANSFERTYLENTITKKGWWSGSKCRP